MAFQLMSSKEQQAEFKLKKELDFSYQTLEGIRFRVNAGLEKGEISLALRRVALEIPTLEQLGLPQICQDLALKEAGFGAGYRSDWQRQINNPGSNDRISQSTGCPPDYHH